MGNTIVRENLMNQKNYSPYCGNWICPYSSPRTDFDGNQFTCLCGWASEFPKDFIEKYKKKWSL